MSPPTYAAALVTGAGHRIGRAVALSLGAADIAVAVHYHGSANAADAVVAEITQNGGRAASVSANLIDEIAVSSLVEKASNALGLPIDILVNNASIFEKDTLTDFTVHSWEQHQKVNLLAPLMLMQHFAQALPRDHKGVVINMIDQRVLKLNPQYLSYTLAKSGLWTATRTAAQALAPNIRVNAVGPGPTLPNHQQTQHEFEAEAASVPLKIGPSPQEIAQAVHFILEAPSMTGQMIALDGGQHLAWRTADIPED